MTHLHIIPPPLRHHLNGQVWRPAPHHQGLQPAEEYLKVRCAGMNTLGAPIFYCDDAYPIDFKEVTVRPSLMRLVS